MPEFLKIASRNFFDKYDPQSTVKSPSGAILALLSITIEK